jgi:L-lactate dehydrogenase complex protein LldG
MTTARDAIFANIRKHRGAGAATPAAYDFPKSADLSAHFIAKARTAIADVREIADIAEAPDAVRAILSGLNVARRVHIPAVSPLAQLSWDRVPDVTVSPHPPTGEDTALSLAEYAVAETGTLAFLSGPRAPSSWHYRPGREIAILRRETILPRLEDLFAKLRADGLPATLNLVTGPSRTADIEQTIELGAHGPCALHILIAGRSQ